MLKSYQGALGRVVEKATGSFLAFDRRGRIVAGRADFEDAFFQLELHDMALRELRRLAQRTAEPGHEVPPIDQWAAGGDRPAGGLGVVPRGRTVSHPGGRRARVRG